MEQVWTNKILVKLSLSQTSISSPANVKPVYLLAPRQGYLPILAQQALPFFQHVLPHLPGQAAPKPWFEFRRLPLKWNIPTGVLFDLLAGPAETPWHLTLHYTNYPESLISWDSHTSLQAQLLNSLKEAAFICRGGDGAASVMRLTGTSQDELTSSLERADGVMYANVLSSLRVVPTERSGSVPSIPVRVFIRSHMAAPVSSAWEYTRASSRPVPATHTDGSPVTLGQALRLLAPEVTADADTPAASTEQHLLSTTDSSVTVQSSEPSSTPSPHPPAPAPPDDSSVSSLSEPPTPTCIDTTSSETTTPNNPETNCETTATQPMGGVVPTTVPGSSSSGAVAAAGLPSHATSSATAKLPGSASCSSDTVMPGNVVLQPNVKVLIQGVEVPLDAPLAWCHANLQCPDCFLYIAVRRGSI